MRISLKNVSTESLLGELQRRFYEEAISKTHDVLRSFRRGNFLSGLYPKLGAGTQAKGTRRRKMSKAARERIAAAQRARWAKQKKEKSA